MPDTTTADSVGNLAPLIATVTDNMLNGDSDAAGIILQAARDTAVMLKTTGAHASVFSPGNGFTYRVATVSLPDPQAAAQSWGGNLLVSLPDFHRCILLNSTGGFHMPYYIDEKMMLGPQHSAVVAAFTTFVDNMLVTH